MQQPLPSTAGYGVGVGPVMSRPSLHAPLPRSQSRSRPPSRPQFRSPSQSSHIARARNSSAQSAAPNHPLALIRSFDAPDVPSRPVRPSPLTTSPISGMPLDLLDRLRSFPLFASAPDTFLTEIGSRLHPHLYQRNDTVFSEGDSALAMYWLVRGAVRITSRDGESTYSLLRPGAFFGEIGVLMDMPRTASVVAESKTLVLRLAKDDLHAILPRYSTIDRAIRDEAAERLSILNRLKQANNAQRRAFQPPPVLKSDAALSAPSLNSPARVTKRSRASLGPDDLASPPPESAKKPRHSSYLTDSAAASALGNSALPGVRQLLQYFPLFATLSTDSLHWLGINAQLRSFPPFVNIISQGSTDRDLYFITRGEVEVVVQPNAVPSSSLASASESQPSPATCRTDEKVQARLKAGQYFGEVTSLSLAPRRTATVRSVSQVECLMISESLLAGLWEKIPSSGIRDQMEVTAKQRLEKTSNQLIFACTMTEGASSVEHDKDSGLADAMSGSSPTHPTLVQPLAAPLDPDPFLSPTLHSVKSRRASLLPPSGSTSPSSSTTSPRGSPLRVLSSSANQAALRRSKSPPLSSATSDLSLSCPTPLAASFSGTSVANAEQNDTLGVLPESILSQVFRNLDLISLLRLREVSSRWRDILLSQADLMHTLDLHLIRRRLTNEALQEVICPFINNRVVYKVEMSDCHQITDQAFLALVRACGRSVRCWRMRSVWDVSGQAILEMAMHFQQLESIDLSNCRKINDQLMAFLIGWNYPVQAVRHPSMTSNAHSHPIRHEQAQIQSNAPQLQEAVSFRSARELPKEPADSDAEGKLAVTEFGDERPKCKGEAEKCTITGENQDSDSGHNDDEDHHDDCDCNDGDHDDDDDGEDDEDEDEDEDEDLRIEGNPNISSFHSTSRQHYPYHSRLLPHYYPQTFMNGLPNLTHLKLSYCKHVTDRTMAHLAYQASDRLVELDLTRCTSITDAGFLQLGTTQFPRLRRVCLADCTYLTDQAILWLVHAAQNLRDLDLTFCCALSDVATEVIALGCSKLERLNMSFCGSAISDLSLRAIGLHLLYMRELSVRGCIRVTGAGVESVVAGCAAIRVFDISQCKHLEPWLAHGGIERMNAERRSRRLSVGDCGCGDVTILANGGNGNGNGAVGRNGPSQTHGHVPASVHAHSHYYYNQHHHQAQQQYRHQHQPHHWYPHHCHDTRACHSSAHNGACHYHHYPAAQETKFGDVSFGVPGCIIPLPPRSDGDTCSSDPAAPDPELPPVSSTPIRFILDASEGWEVWNRMYTSM